MRTVRQIADAAIMGNDCSEEESSEIKGYFREKWNSPDQLFFTLLQHFPFEYGEVETEKEQEKVRKA